MGSYANAFLIPLDRTLHNVVSFIPRFLVASLGVAGFALGFALKDILSRLYDAGVPTATSATIVQRRAEQETSALEAGRGARKGETA